MEACGHAGICSVEVSEQAVHMTGFYPGSFPEGYCGYYAKERDGKLYVGFRFSAVFGIFESGDYLFMNNDIIYVAKETDAPVPFTITVYAEDDTVLPSEAFHFDVGTEKMYLTVTEDGRIVEEFEGV